MNKITQYQYKDLMKQVQQTEHEKIQKIKKLFEVKQESLSEKKIYELIKSGKVKIRNDIGQINKYDNVNKIFDFSGFNGESKIDYKKMDNMIDSIKKLASQARVCIHSKNMDSTAIAIKNIEEF